LISASKTTFSHNNLKVLRPEVTKNITNLRKKFCEFRPRTSFQTIIIIAQGQHYNENYSHMITLAGCVLLRKKWTIITIDGVGNLGLT